MEYLMTYGWAILIIAVVLGALFSLGVFNGTNFAPRVPAGACRVERLATQIALAGECQGGLPQYVAKFDGSTSYVAVPSSPSLSLTGSFTISAWVYVNARSINHDQVVVGKGLSSHVTSEYELFYGWGYDQYIDAANGIDQTNGWGGVTSDIGSYVNLVGVYNSTGRSEKVYYNGALEVNALAPASLTQNTNDMTIGDLAAGGSYFNGMIADVQVYNASLSPQEVNALYLEGIGGAPIDVQNIVGWWPLNGNANDYSGLDNNGQATGVSYTGSYLSSYTPP